MKSEELQGLKVLVFEMSASDVSLGTNPQNGLAMFANTTVTLTIEPKTGTVVDQNATSITSMDMGGNKVPVLVANVAWTDATVADMVKTAKDGVGMLFWFQAVLPWLLIDIGAVSLIIGVVLMVRKQRTAAW